MSSFEDLARNVCKVVTADGAFSGTAFFVLPEGRALTCHHVVFGMSEIWVQLSDETTPHLAEYDAEHSNAEADIAVLRVPGITRPGLQLGRCRPTQLAYGYGFRPAAISQEPAGHTFAGRLSPGQPLFLEPSKEDKAFLYVPGDAANQPWNQLPNKYRTGLVFTFDLVKGVVQGISGGPVYDTELRRVTGILRAVEGQDQAYVLPLDTVFDHKWRELEDENKLTVRDSMFDRLAGYGVTESGTPALPLVDDHLEAVYRDYTLFGGRTRELGVLSDFARSEDGGYVFVTGPPLGYGKTALLVELVRRLRGQVALAVHFLNRKYPDWISPQACLKNLSLQLMQIHGLGGSISDTAPIYLLKAIYAHLLRVAPRSDQRVVVVLDGLDETIGQWVADASLFPVDLPRRVKVIFSAQSVADLNWLDHLGLKLPTDRILTIERLNAPDVAAILEVSKIYTADPTMASGRLFKLSGGDAFYLLELLEDLGKAGGDLTKLAGRPSGDEYLRAWWAEAREEIGEDAFDDLMGTLAVAVAPLGADELVQINESRTLKGKEIDRVLKTASRHITGNRQDGYQLSHARIRQFVVDIMKDEISNYNMALLDFCLNWKDAKYGKSALYYVLRYGVRQIVELKQFGRITELLTSEFISATWLELGSFRSYIDDLSIAASALYRQQRTSAPLVIGLLVARQTVRDTISAIPAEVFAGWIRLGDVERALTMADDLAETHGRASDQFLEIAEELLRLGRDPLGTTQHTVIAASLLQRALDLIPRIRLPFLRYETLERLVGIAANPGTTPKQKTKLAQQAIKLGQAIADPLERSFVLGLASYLSAIGGDKPMAKRALELAEQAATRIALASDRLLVFLYRTQAILELFPQDLEARFPGFDAITNREMTFPLGYGRPCHVVARKLADLGPASGRLLRELARQVATDIADRAVDASYIVNALVRVGAVEEAIMLIDRANQSSAHALKVILNEIDDPLFLRNPPDRAWSLEARQHAAPHLLAAVGDWNTALSRLREIQPSQLARELRAIMRVIDRDLGIGVVPLDAWSTLTHLIAQLPDADKLQCMAVAVLAASGNPQMATNLLEEVMRLVVGHSSRGGTEQLEALHAVALHQSDCQPEAAKAAAQIYDLRVATDTLVALIDYSKADTAAIALYAGPLSECLTLAQSKQKPDILESVAAAWLNLVKAHPEAGKTLYERTADWPKTPRSTVDLAVLGCASDPVGGWKQCADLVTMIAKEPPSKQLDLICAALDGLARVPVVPAGEAAAFLQSADRILKTEVIEIASYRTKSQLETARASLLARYAPDEAISLLQHKLALLATPRPKSEGELAAISFIIAAGVLTYGPAGHKLDEASDAVAIWNAALPALEDRPDRILALLGDVLKLVRQLASPADETTALIRILADAAELTPTQRSIIASRLDQAIEQASSIARGDYQTMALQSAVRTFVAVGDIARAERANGLIKSTELSDRMDGVLAAAKDRKSSLSPVERHLTRLLPRSNGAFLVAYQEPSETDRWPSANYLMELLLGEEEAANFVKRLSREDFLRLALCFACALYRIEGASMIAQMIATIGDYDQRFRQASSASLLRARV
jgi:hypothetical protein